MAAAAAVAAATIVSWSRSHFNPFGTPRDSDRSNVIPSVLRVSTTVAMSSVIAQGYG